MGRSDLLSKRRSPGLYARIGYSVELEAQAFRRLAELDIPGCRRSFGALVEALRLSEMDGEASQVVQLLVDILQKVNRRIHRGPDEEEAYQSNRVALIEMFSDCGGALEARQRFLGALNRLLSPLRPGRRSSNPLVERAKGYIAETYHRRLSLSTVADHLHVSPNYLSRLFRRETGITLTSFIQQVRLEHALVLLAEGRQSISEIAYRVGYQNYRDFYRNFVKYENASPRQVRRKLAR
jgi:AraC-like DNA-binding protein